VSGYGIGVAGRNISALPGGNTFLQNIPSGIYFGSSITGGPRADANEYEFIVLANSGGADSILASCRQDGAMFKGRRLYGGGAVTWDTVFTSLTDGNDGQQPAPKPTLGTPAGGANGVGQGIVILPGAGVGYTLPNPGTSGSSTWKWNYTKRNGTNFIIADAGINVGGTLIASGTSTDIVQGYCERIS